MEERPVFRDSVSVSGCFCPSSQLSVSQRLGSGESLRSGMTLSSPQQYPEGVFYDLDSCKPFSYSDSDGGPGE